MGLSTRHRVCVCDHGQNEHFADDSGIQGDQSWCEGCVEAKPKDRHRFAEKGTDNRG